MELRLFSSVSVLLVFLGQAIAHIGFAGGKVRVPAELRKFIEPEPRCRVSRSGKEEQSCRGKDEVKPFPPPLTHR